MIIKRSKIRIIVLLFVIMLVSVMIMGYCNSRRKKYLPVNSRDYGTHFLTAEKNRLDKSGKFMHIFTYRLALGFGNGSAGGKTGSILKDPDQWNMDYDPKAYKKAWVDLTPFETYLLFDLAEKYVDEDKFYYPEYKNANFFKKGYYIIEDEVQLSGAGKHKYKIGAKPHETAFIYQIVVFLYYFHKYFWFILSAIVILTALCFTVKKRISVS